MTISTENDVALHVKKGHALRRKLLFPKLIIWDKDRKAVIKKRMFKKEFSFTLPAGQYHAEVSILGGVFGKKIESFRKIDLLATKTESLVIDICNINYLAAVVPFLGYLTPLFDFSLQFGERERQTDTKFFPTNKISKHLAILFNVLALIFSCIVLTICMQACLSGLYTDITDQSFVNAHLSLKGTDSYTAATCEYVGGGLSSVFLFIILLLATMFFMRLSRFFTKRSRIRQVDTANPTLPPSYSIYLRSFDSDHITGEELSHILRPGQTEESLLVEKLNEIAPVYAIGCPKDKYLPKGAGRIYVSDAEWQDKVTELAKDAQLIILRLGETKGFWWEVEHCLRNIPLRKLLFIIPATDNVDVIAMLYAKMLQYKILNKSLNLNIVRKSKTNIAGFIFFDEKGQPTFRKFKMNLLQSWFVSLDDMMEQCMFDFLSRFQVHIKKRNLTLRAAFGGMTALMLVMIFSLGQWLRFHNFERNRFPKDVLVACQQYPDVEQFVSIEKADRHKTYLLSSLGNAGAMLFNNDEAIELFGLNCELMQAITPREAELIHDQLTDNSVQLSLDMLILAKKYLTPENHRKYIEYILRGCRLFIENRNAVTAAYQQLQPSIEKLQERSAELTPKRHQTDTLSQDEKREYLLGLYLAAAQLYHSDPERIDLIKMMLMLPLS